MMPWALVLLPALWAGCGGSDSPPPPAELAVVLGLPGPGDPDGYLPMASGNFWHFTGAASGSFGTTVDKLVMVSGTQRVGGAEAWVLREVFADSSRSATERHLALDANGLALLAIESATDVLERGPVPYWELRFPLAVGSSFVQTDRRQIDSGQDLDGDGRTERVDLRSRVQVIGPEPVTVPVGSYAGALRVDRRTTLSFTRSRDGRVVPATALDIAWLVPGLGWVRRTRSFEVEGTVSSSDEQLDAYRVNGSSAGFVLPSSASLNGALSAGQGLQVAWPDQPAGRYTVWLSGVRSATTLSVPGATCRVGLAGPGRGAPMDCNLTLDRPGPVVARLQALADTNFVMGLVPTPAVANPADEVLTLTGNVDLVGQVGPRGTSRYVVTGLAPFRYGVVLFGLDQDADLHLYTDASFATELACTQRSPADTLPTPEDCLTSPIGGALYIGVAAAESGAVGAGFRLRVGAAQP